MFLAKQKFISPCKPWFLQMALDCH